MESHTHTHTLSRRSVEARGKIEIWVQMQVSKFFLINKRPTGKNKTYSVAVNRNTEKPIHTYSHLHQQHVSSNLTRQRDGK